MNILFVHEVDWMKKVVFEIHTLAELMSLSGHRVYAIDYESLWEKTGPFDLGSLRTTVIEGVGRGYPEASVTLVRPGYIRIPVISRLSAGFTHYREIGRTIRERNIDAVILYSVPTNGVQTVHIAKKLGVPVIFRSIDILNQLTPSSVLAPLTRLLERHVYANVDLILTISPRLSEYVIDLGARRDRVKLLPLGIDTGVFRPGLDTDGLRNQWGIGSDIPVVVFIGTLFDFSGLDIFLRRFREVLEQVAETRLLIVGDGPQRPELEHIIAETGLADNVTITGFQPYETMPLYMNMATVLINTFLITDATRDIFPGKIVQYQACGKPVVATALPGLIAIVPGEEQGIVYSDSPGGMAEKITALLQSEERRRELGQAALTYVKHAHSYDRIVQELETHITALTGSGSGTRRQAGAERDEPSR